MRFRRVLTLPGTRTYVTTGILSLVLVILLTYHKYVIILIDEMYV